MTILFAILLFSLLIFVHELGHFLAAKASGVRVNEFSMFMGPAIWKKQIGETLYAIRCIPFGGYCAMEGEDEVTDDPRSFQKVAWWKRMIILVAGSAMNFIAGLLLIALVVAPMNSINILQISEFTEWSTLSGEDGLQAGDQILSIDGEKMYLYSDFSLILSLNTGDVHDVTVLRNGETVELTDFVMEKHTVTYDDGTTAEKYGVTFAVEELTFGGRLEYIWNTAVDWVRTVRLSLQMLFSGQASFSDVSGPVGIVSQMNDVAQASSTWRAALRSMVYFGAFIAVNLSVMNMLPIPALDGGRVVALLVTTIIEAVIHRKIDPKYEGYIHGAFMIALLALMAVIMFKDIFAIFKG